MSQKDCASSLVQVVSGRELFDVCLIISARSIGSRHFAFEHLGVHVEEIVCAQVTSALSWMQEEVKA